ncbi:MAG: response regulator [Bryobacterales bacterium]|jgi:two-component system chemotaxis response regulator CheY|nr:response regulator [Bryobacterales bacterium]
MSQAMVVDDSRTIRRILTRTLQDIGYHTVEAGNGLEAWEMLECLESPLDLILLDWNMPEMNGLQFLRKLRADRRFDDIKLMMVTTETQAEQMLEALEAGANEYVMKPFTRDIIEDKLRLMNAL